VNLWLKEVRRLRIVKSVAALKYDGSTSAFRKRPSLMRSG
jgi:hypothetical protein